jgi:cytochrome c-type biogenesis protein CcmH
MIAALAGLAILFVAAAPASAAVGCPKTTELAMESRVMCTVCGVPLDVASSLEANRERAFMTRMVKRCDSVSQIEQAMVAQYGPAVLATPSRSGFSLTAWLVPAAGLVVAAVAIGLVIASARGRRRRGIEPDGDAPPISRGEGARLDAALADHRRRP